MSVFILFILYLYEVKHSEIKQNIIETASFLFYKNGYNSTGINEIIAESGIAKATLYNHFKSKEDICLAYLQFKNTTFLTDLKEYCSSLPKGTPQLLGIFEFLENFFVDDDFNGCWCIKTVSEIPKENEKIRAEIKRQKELFIQLITNLVESNKADYSTSKTNLVARQIYLLYESAVAESHLHQAKWPIEETKNICIELLK